MKKKQNTLLKMAIRYCLVSISCSCLAAWNSSSKKKRDYNRYWISLQVTKRESSQWHFQNIHKSFRKEMQKTITKTNPNLWHRSDVSLNYFECIATKISNASSWQLNWIFIFTVDFQLVHKISNQILKHWFFFMFSY